MVTATRKFKNVRFFSLHLLQNARPLSSNYGLDSTLWPLARRAIELRGSRKVVMWARVRGQPPCFVKSAVSGQVCSHPGVSVLPPAARERDPAQVLSRGAVQRLVDGGWAQALGFGSSANKEIKKYQTRAGVLESTPSLKARLTD